MTDDIRLVLTEQAELTNRYSEVMVNAFGAPKRVFERGEGVHLIDADGNRYTDLLSGLAVNALGHNHPGVTAAIAAQLGHLGHVSNFFASEPQVRLAERLADAAVLEAPFETGAGRPPQGPPFETGAGRPPQGPPFERGVVSPPHHGPGATRGSKGGARARVFFTNSGTEANEAAFKLTRLTGRTSIVAMEGAFHGRTMGALAITYTPKYREPFEPLPGDVRFVPYGDVEALRAAVDETTAAVVLEPIQGENGVVPAPEGFVAAAREITTAAGALLWIDEVQTGMGRCGELLLHRSAGITADLITVAKGLGNGFPIGACLAVGPAADLLQPGQHGTTFGGNPVAAAAGNAVLDALEGGVLDNARQTGAWLRAQLDGLDHPAVAGVRGAGMLLGVVLNADIAPQVADAALEAGWIINAPRPNVLRLAPPLISRPEDLQGFLDLLPELLDRHG